MTWKFWERWTKRTKPLKWPNPYPRVECPECFKVVAKTSRGLWPHKCVEYELSKGDSHVDSRLDSGAV